MIESPPTPADQLQTELYDFVYSACRRNWNWMPPLPKREWSPRELIQAFTQAQRGGVDDDELETEILRATFHLIVQAPWSFESPEWIKIQKFHRKIAFRHFFEWLRNRHFRKQREELWYRCVAQAFSEWRSATADEYVKRREEEMDEEATFLRSLEYELTEQLNDQKWDWSERPLASIFGSTERRLEQVAETREILYGSIGGADHEWDSFIDEQVDLLREWLRQRALPSTPEDLKKLSDYIPLGDPAKWNLRNRNYLYEGVGHLAGEGNPYGTFL